MKKTTRRNRPRQVSAKEIERQRRASDKAYKKLIAKIEKRRQVRDKEYAKLLQRLRATGIYEPKGQRLTKYRKSRINKAAKEYSEYLNPTTFFFVPINKNARAKLLGRAKALSMKITRKGIFIDKEGYTRAQIRKSPTYKDEYEIHQTGKVKYGPTKGKKYERIIPLATTDELLVEEKRIYEIGKSLGKTNGERLYFRIIDESGEGMSWNSYSTVELLIQALYNYQRSDAARIHFFRHITVEKHTPVNWLKEKRERGLAQYHRKRRAKGRTKRG